MDLKTFETLLQILTGIQELGEPEDCNDTEYHTCYECGGNGTVTDYDDEDNEIEVECPECGGEGEYEEDINGEEVYCELLEEFDDKFYEIGENNFLADCEKFLQNYNNIKDIDISDINIKTVTKPRCKLIGKDGNVFNIIGIVARTLKEHDMNEEAEEFKNKAFSSKSYDTVLQLCMDYVTIY